MHSKKASSSLFDSLLAVASLIGLGRAIEILESERATASLTLIDVQRAVRQMTIVDLAEAVRSPIRAKTTQAAHRPIKRAVPATARGVSTWNGSVSDAQRVCASTLAAGPTPIRSLLTALRKAGIVRDTDPDTRRQLVEFLAKDKTFSVKTRGVYTLRSKSA